MVCAWCIALIAVCAMALVVKVTNAQPGKRRINNSSIHLFNYLSDLHLLSTYCVPKYHASNTDVVPAFRGS